MSYQLNAEQNMIQAMVRDLARDLILPTAAERDEMQPFVVWWNPEISVQPTKTQKYQFISEYISQAPLFLRYIKRKQ